MVELKKLDNGTFQASANADIFVIPNHAAHIADYLCGKEQRQEQMEAICKANLLEFNSESDWLVETWMTSEDLESDNVADHGFTIYMNGKEMRAELPYGTWRNLPK